MFQLSSSFYSKYKTIQQEIYETDFGCTQENFLELLPYWDKYYACRTRELYRLEYSTGYTPNDLFNMRQEIEVSIETILKENLELEEQENNNIMKWELDSLPSRN